MTTLFWKLASFHVEDVQICMPASSTFHSITGFDMFPSLESVQFIQDCILLKELNICLVNRENIIKLQSLAHYQCASVKFISMFR